MKILLFSDVRTFIYFLPEIVITLRPTAIGGFGGASRRTNGSGVDGLGGC